MLKRTEEVRQELCKKKHWEKSYERLQAKNYEPRVYEEMFIIYNNGNRVRRYNRCVNGW